MDTTADAVSGRRLKARAMLLGERIATGGFHPPGMVTTAPLSFRVADKGFVVVFRYGAIVLIELDAAQEGRVLAEVAAFVAGSPTAPEDETVTILVSPDQEELVTPGGVVQIRSASSETLLIVADVLAKSVALAGDERQVAAVFETVEPFAAALVAGRRWPGGRRGIVRLIGRGLLVQHRLSGRVAVREKPDILWDRPDLERLYARLEDEYELAERAETLDRKLGVIAASAGALLDIEDTARSLRLEVLVVLLILAELVLGLSQHFGLISD
jgi:required for meiotic nuclear division protein 1